MPSPPGTPPPPLPLSPLHTHMCLPTSVDLNTPCPPQVQSDFMPILREVLGRLPASMVQGEASAPAIDLDAVAAQQVRVRIAP